MNRPDPHPMLYPLADVPPEEMARKHSDGNMQKAYRILWDNTLSHLSKRPLVREHRALFGKEDITLAVAGVEVLGKGWLTYQNLGDEAPPMPVPDGGLSGAVYEGSYLEDLQSEIEELPRGVPLSDLLLWLSENRIASPGTLSNILARMQGAGWIHWPVNGQITISDAGRSLWNDAQNAGFGLTVEAVRQFREVLDGIESEGGGDLSQSAQSAFHVIGLDLAESIQWMQDLGIPEDVGDPTTPHEDDTLPEVLGYPAAIDPERCLRADAPERLARYERERALRAFWGERWLRLRQRDRILCRLAAKVREEGQGSEPMDQWCERTRFDVLLRWEIGMSAEDLSVTPKELEECAASRKAEAVRR